VEVFDHTFEFVRSTWDHMCSNKRTQWNHKSNKRSKWRMCRTDSNTWSLFWTQNFL